jgi:hypothetical protein
MSGLRVLMTNNTLASRAGSELYIRDLATALVKRGHTPIAYSMNLGDVASDLRAATVAVIDDLDLMATPPDIIHGQHHLETMTALLNFPSVPAIYFCHGWLPWEEAPPRFPRILRYVAIDHTCRDRLVFEHSIAEDDVRVILNFVDLERFRPRPRLPDSPRRALVFSNYANEHTHLGAVRQACNGAGIQLDVLGLGAGNATASPEKILVEYDLVFAKGRSALEAAATGAAVILCDMSGVGPMVTTEEFDRLRALNFGVRALRGSVDSETIGREIARYDAQDAAKVSRRLRETAGLEKAADEIISLYEDVVAKFKTMPQNNLRDEERAASAYLRWLSPRMKQIYQLQNQAAAQDATIKRLQAENARLNQEIETSSARSGERKPRPHNWLWKLFR